MTEKPKYVKELPADVRAKAVDAAAECYSKNAITQFIDNAFIGGQVKQVSGPSEDKALNGCAKEMIGNTLSKSGVKLYDGVAQEVTLDIMKEGYTKAKGPQAASAPSR